MTDHPVPRTPTSGRVILAATLVIALVLTAVAVAWLRGPGPDAIHDLATLPARFGACGRTFHDPGQVQTLASIRGRGIEPVLVDPAPLAPCPAGVFVNFAGNVVIRTIVFVRVGDDAFVEYTLSGGP